MLVFSFQLFGPDRVTSGASSSAPSGRIWTCFQLQGANTQKFFLCFMAASSQRPVGAVISPSVQNFRYEKYAFS